jgi:hypothetical protein
MDINSFFTILTIVALFLVVVYQSGVLNSLIEKSYEARKQIHRNILNSKIKKLDEEIQSLGSQNEMDKVAAEKNVNHILFQKFYSEYSGVSDADKMKQKLINQSFNQDVQKYAYAACDQDMSCDTEVLGNVSSKIASATEKGAQYMSGFLPSVKLIYDKGFNMWKPFDPANVQGVQSVMGSDSPNTYSVRFENTNKCITIHSQDSVNVQGDCTNTDWQQFRVIPVSEFTFKLKNEHLKMLLGHTENGVNVKMVALDSVDAIEFIQEDGKLKYFDKGKGFDSSPVEFFNSQLSKTSGCFINVNDSIQMGSCGLAAARIKNFI